MSLSLYVVCKLHDLYNRIYKLLLQNSLYINDYRVIYRCMVRLFQLFLFCTTLSIIFAGDGIAKDISVAVSVDETSNTALNARTAALRKSEKQAFWKLIDRMAPEKSAEFQSSISDGFLHSLVKDFTIKDEKVTAGRYRANITYIFDSVKVKRFIFDSEAVITGSANDNILILPILDDGHGLKLWEKDNIWRSIFNKAALEVGKGKLIMPYGDAGDKHFIDNEILLSGDKMAMSKISQKYGTRKSAFVVAKLSKNDGQIIMDVRLRRAGAVRDEVGFSYTGLQGETVKKMMFRAARDIAKKLSDATDRYSLFKKKKGEGLSQQKVKIYFKNSREWQKLRNILNDLSDVELLSEDAVTIDYAKVTLYYAGSEMILKRGILAQGLKLNAKHDDWVVN